MHNICHIKFAIPFNHTYYCVNKNLPIFHYINAQIQETPYFGYQRHFTLFSKQNSWIQTDRWADRHTNSKTDRQIERQTNRQSDRQWLIKTDSVTVTDISKSYTKGKSMNSDTQRDRQTESQTYRQQDRQIDIQTNW